MKSSNVLAEIRERAIAAMDNKKNGETKILVGYATCGMAAGAKPVLDRLAKEIKERNLSKVTLTPVGCIGMCRLEPMLDVIDPDGTKTTYVNVDEEVAKRIVEEHIVGGKVVEDHIIGADGR